MDEINYNGATPPGYGYSFPSPCPNPFLKKISDDPFDDFFDGKQNPQKQEEQEDLSESLMIEALRDSEIRSLGAENEIRYIYRENDLYMIMIKKSKNYVVYVFSNCVFQNFYISHDGKKAAVKFTHLGHEQTVIFDIADLSTGKVFRQLTANGYPVIFKISGETKYCFESFISQRLLEAKRYPTITKGFSQINKDSWRFCHRDNHRQISPFTYGDLDESALEIHSEINLQSSYNVIKNYLGTLTEDICTQDFLFFLFAYLPIYPILKAYKCELDKTIHFIGSTEISEDIINNFLKVFNKGEGARYCLSMTPSGIRGALSEIIHDIQPFYYFGGYNEWNKYRMPNYGTLTTVNSGFGSDDFLSVPVIVNVPLFQTDLDKAIIIDTGSFKEADRSYNMIPFFNYFTLKWVEFLEKNQAELMDSMKMSINIEESPEINQAAKCIYRVVKLLRSFLNINLPINTESMLKQSMAFLHRQNQYELNCGLDSHIKRYFREFFQDESRYKAYCENASISSDDLEHQIFYSDNYVAISSDTLSFILKPLLDCEVHKREIMEQLSMWGFLYKSKEDSYCSTAYLTDSSGQLRKKNVVQFRRKILDWLKLDIAL